METFLLELAKILVPVALSYFAVLKIRAELALSISQSQKDIDQSFGKIRELQGIPNAYRRNNASIPPDVLTKETSRDDSSGSDSEASRPPSELGEKQSE